MAKSMTKAQTVAQLSTVTGVTKQDVSSVLDALTNLAYQEAQNGFTVPGLGKLVLVDRKARTGRNPKTGESIEIPAKRAVKFRLSAVAKDAILH